MLTMLINWQNVMEAEIIVKMDAALKPLVVFEHIISRVVSLLCCGAMEDVSSNHQCIRHRHHVIFCQICWSCWVWSISCFTHSISVFITMPLENLTGDTSPSIYCSPNLWKTWWHNPFPRILSGRLCLFSIMFNHTYDSQSLSPVDIHIPATFAEHLSYTTWGAEVTKTEDVILYNLTLLVMRRSRSTRSDSWTPWWHPKTNGWNLQITPIEKENHLNQTSILGFHVNFRGVNLYL